VPPPRGGRTSAFSVTPESFSLDRLLYCYKDITRPDGGHEASAPPAVRCACPRPRRFAYLREYRHLCHACTHTPSRHLCHSCTIVYRPRCPDRGSCGMMLGSPRCDSVRSRRASVRGSLLTIGTDASQPRPRRSPCTHGPVCREGARTRPACLPLPRPYGHRQRSLASDL
jgi:hypothetical protein